MNLNEYIDHTLLKPTAKLEDYKKICEEAIQYKFKAVCVAPFVVKNIKEYLKNSSVKIATVIGFPLGYNTVEVKAAEAKNAIDNGADEIDMVINYGAIIDGKWDYINYELSEMRKVVKNKILKVILEISELNNDQIKEASLLCVKHNIDFVKTSTGFSKSGATVEAVTLIKTTIKNSAFIKAAGGIRSYEDAIAMINAGATRLGTSQGVALMQGAKIDKNKY